MSYYLAAIAVADIIVLGIGEYIVARYFITHKLLLRFLHQKERNNPAENKRVEHVFILYKIRKSLFDGLKQSK